MWRWQRDLAATQDQNEGEVRSEAAKARGLPASRVSESFSREKRPSKVEVKKPEFKSSGCNKFLHHFFLYLLCKQNVQVDEHEGGSHWCAGWYG